MKDSAIEQLIQKEADRQRDNIELIASENYTSKEVREVTGSILTNKYAEGYPNKRYYGGCVYVDGVEELARERLCQLFHAEHANVQPHSGSQANMAVYLSCLNFGDKVLGMDLASGGHLTHGHTLNFSGRLYEFHSYGVNKETERIDYEEVREKALSIKPKLIVAGASAYSRFIDYQKFQAIAEEAGAKLMVDMAHIAGMVAVGLHPTPIPYADYVTSTTHKTLRGPRGGVVLCKEKDAAVLDRNVFPGMQGGPLMHVIAGKAVCFYEALQPSFLDYQKQLLANAQTLAKTLEKEGFRLVSGGTDNHMMLVDVKASINMTGKEAERLLDFAGITCNKNTIPFDSERPMVTSGIRLGTPAMTTRGFKEQEFQQVGHWISEVLKHPSDDTYRENIHQEIIRLTRNYPVE